MTARQKQGRLGAWSVTLTSRSWTACEDAGLRQGLAEGRAWEELRGGARGRQDGAALPSAITIQVYANMSDLKFEKVNDEAWRIADSVDTVAGMLKKGGHMMFHADNVSGKCVVRTLVQADLTPYSVAFNGRGQHAVAVQHRRLRSAPQGAV